jgi:hypothetical protein
MTQSPEVISFGNRSAADRRELQRFVLFHWTHYQDDVRYVPLLDYEYLGSRPLGITGFFEARNLFFTHGDVRFFLALHDGRIVGRCNAFVNRLHNAHARDRAGFFGNRQQRIARELGYEYCDLGWVLETNRPVIRMAERFGAVPSKRYALFEKVF